jgi:hypothetical protein
MPNLTLLCARNLLKKKVPMYKVFPSRINIQGVIEMRDQILTTSYWLHVELGKNILKILCQKIN